MINSLDKTWGFSGLVGEWHLERSEKVSDNLSFRAKFEKLVEFFKIIIPIISKLHQLNQAKIDISFISEDGAEKDFWEDVELDTIDLDNLLTNICKIIQPLDNCLITRIDIDLDTKVIHNQEETIVPQSANLYIGADNDWDNQYYEIYLSYSTFIDVWLEKTLDSGKKYRDNSTWSQENKPNLIIFLKELEKKTNTILVKGESYYYSEQLKKYGF